MNLPCKLRSIVQSRAEVAGQLKFPGDAVLIKRGQPRWLLLKCPCGCGDEIPVNLDSRAGKAWRVYGETASKVTLFPSVWRDTGCGSHFIVWRGEILLFGRAEEEEASSSVTHTDVAALGPRVLERLSRDTWVLYVDIADALGEIPWDVLDVCRYLARAGSVVEASGKQRGLFRRR